MSETGSVVGGEPVEERGEWDLRSLQRMASEIEDTESITPRSLMRTSFSDLSNITEQYIKKALQSSYSGKKRLSLVTYVCRGGPEQY